MESGYVTEIDTTLVSIKNKLRKMNHINPYTKKRLTRRTRNSMNEATTINIPIKLHNTQTFFVLFQIFQLFINTLHWLDIFLQIFQYLMILFILIIIILI